MARGEAEAVGHLAGWEEARDGGAGAGALPAPLEELGHAGGGEGGDGDVGEDGTRRGVNEREQQSLEEPGLGVAGMGEGEHEAGYLSLPARTHEGDDCGVEAGDGSNKVGLDAGTHGGLESGGLDRGGYRLRMRRCCEAVEASSRCFRGEGVTAA